MKERFKKLRESYKYFSGIDPVGNIMAIGTNVFNEIISNCEGLVDQKTLKLSDVDLEFVATKAGSKNGGPRNPERQLIRY
jgi:hypothetical protein